jgi:hypothetical protein
MFGFGEEEVDTQQVVGGLRGGDFDLEGGRKGEREGGRT